MHNQNAATGIDFRSFVMAKNKHKNTVNNSKPNVVNNGLEAALDLPSNNYLANPLINPATLFYNSSPYY